MSFLQPIISANKSSINLHRNVFVRHRIQDERTSDFHRVRKKSKSWHLAHSSVMKSYLTVECLLCRPPANTVSQTVGAQGAGAANRNELRCPALHPHPYPPPPPFPPQLLLLFGLFNRTCTLCNARVLSGLNKKCSETTCTLSHQP